MQRQTSTRVAVCAFAMTAIGFLTIAVILSMRSEGGRDGVPPAGAAGTSSQVLIEPVPSATPAVSSRAEAPTVASAAVGTEPSPVDVASKEAPPATPSPAIRPPALPARALAGVRVWADGDSTSYFVSYWFLQLMAARGAVAVQPVSEYKISSGLLNPSYFDWPAYVRSQIATLDPDVLMFMVGANDAHAGMPLDAYHARVGEMMDLMGAGGRRVIWVGQPNMARPDLAAAVPAENDVFRAEAAARPWVTFVDVWALTSDADGNYARYLVDDNGNLVQARGDDGVHLTSAGGRIVALAVLAAYLER